MHKRTPLITASVLLGLAATAAVAGPPPRAWGPGYYRPPVVVGPVYPGWRAGYWGGYAAGYWGPGYWGPRVVVTPGVVAPWPYALGGVYALPYAPAPVVVGAVPAPAPVAPEPSYWYYCTQPAGYYPYVQQCSQPWMKVVPQQPGDNSAPPQLAP